MFDVGLGLRYVLCVLAVEIGGRVYTTGKAVVQVCYLVVLISEGKPEMAMVAGRFIRSARVVSVTDKVASHHRMVSPIKRNWRREMEVSITNQMPINRHVSCAIN